MTTDVQVKHADNNPSAVNRVTCHCTPPVTTVGWICTSLITSPKAPQKISRTPNVHVTWWELGAPVLWWRSWTYQQHQHHHQQQQQPPRQRQQQEQEQEQEQEKIMTRTAKATASTRLSVLLLLVQDWANKATSMQPFTKDDVSNYAEAVMSYTTRKAKGTWYQYVSNYQTLSNTNIPSTPIQIHRAQPNFCIYYQQWKEKKG